MKILRITGAEEWNLLVVRVKDEGVDIVFWTDAFPTLEIARAMARDLDRPVAVFVPGHQSSAKLATWLRDAAQQFEDEPVEEIVPVFEKWTDVRRAIYWIRPDRRYAWLFEEDPPDVGTWIDMREA